MGNGVRKPRLRTPGTDLSGVVESTGKNAEFAAVPQDFLVLKPKNVTFEQAEN
jgi:NADPH:quinone reductase-like Zn-dependent oxidoreductase